MKRFTIFIYFLFFILCVSAQNVSNFRHKKIIIKADSLIFDTLSIVAGSFKFDLPEDELKFKIDYRKKQLIRLVNNIIPDTINFSYKVYPFNFEKEYFNKDIKKLNQDLSLPNNPFNISFNKATLIKNKTAFESDGLTKNGSISRGISFGNSQDIVVNSSLNLQVSGKLDNDIELSLAATDNNIPIQPDGNTQQLQEFDKVYIQLNNKAAKMVVGDFQIERPKSYFMNFYKRTQGVSFTSKNEISTKNKNVLGTFTNAVTAAVSKGRFARDVLQGIENNQGPYRLRGADNEPFIIVLSGTEKVYIDGKLLTRGQENDYVVDYNNSEITFTAKNLITKDKRVIIEFQYAERNYARALYFVSSEFKTEKMRFFFDFYKEVDNKNKVLQQKLSDSEKLILNQVGDTLAAATGIGYSLATFNTTEVFYRKTDTIVIASGIIYPNVLVYSTNADSAKYRAKFTLVGIGNGNYKQIQSSANGRVYAWYAPVAGVLQGDYEPIIQLVTPKKKQMLVAGAEYKLGKNGNIFFESVLSTNDKNTFSSVDSRDDNGQGVKVLLTNKNALGKSDTLGRKNIGISYGLGYEFVQKNFTQIERFRNVEFDRDWNRNIASLINNDQSIINGNLGVELGSVYKANYNFSSFLEGNLYAGTRQTVSNNFYRGPVKATHNASYTTTNTGNNATNFYRHKSNIALKFKNLQLGYIDDFENNLFKYTPTDSISSRSYQFYEWETNIANTDSSGNYFKLFYKERLDKKAYTQKLGDSAYAQNAGFQFNLNKYKNHILKTNMTIRKLQFLGANLLNNKPDNNLLSRIEYAPKLFKGFMQSSIYYEVGYGTELKREFSYLEVAPGQGQYAWQDYNNNGIKELNEFEISSFADRAIYIRVFTPTNNYIKVNHEQFSYSMFLRPSVFKSDKNSKLTKFIMRFSTQTAYRVDKKTQAQFNIATINPFDANTNDSLMTAMGFNFRQALFFNQSAQVFGFDYTFQDNRNKQLLTNGYESRGLQTNELRVRYNATKAWGIFVNSTYGLKINESQFFTTRNYRISYVEAEPKISYQPNTFFRISLIYKLADKRNVYYGEFQHATLNDVGMEIKYNQLTRGTISAKANFIQIAYNDVGTSAVAYEMLNALKTGQNFTWGATFQCNLSNNMQISITYEGRKSPGNNVVNIGGAQVRAFF